MTTWTCVTCNMNCERYDPTEEEMEDLQGCYCPYMDAYTEWTKDGDDSEEEE